MRSRAVWDEAGNILRDSNLGPDAGGYFLRVLDEHGEVVASRGGGQGRGSAAFTPEVTEPIMVNGRQIGVLLAAKAGQGGQGSRAGEQYLASVNQAIFVAGFVAIVLALLLGMALAQRLTRPLRQLSQATTAVAAGELGQQVSITTHDEVGELAARFNDMSQALANAEKQRQQLLADTAHDLRTPISIMQSHLEAMIDGVFPPTPDNLGTVYEETLRLGRLVNDVRTLSLAEAGQLPLDRQPVTLSDLVAQAAAAFQPLAEADGIQLQVQLAATPPILADALRLHQVLANLIANALRYAPQGSQSPPQVTIRVDNVADGILVSVSDSGPGLTPEQQTQVFDRFWRSDAARSREQGGSGLGLAIARSIVEAHGGVIGVESQVGQGTRFWFQLATSSTVQ
jgi:two-component system sensor histidine kinase BaeS